MASAKSVKPSWHGIPREEIKWHPTVERELCIGCGLCVLGCAANVYAFDYNQNKPVVVAPLNCKVGCVTCANTCPTHAISFPPLSYLHKVIKQKKVLAKSSEELKENMERLAYKSEK
ncbi:MAG: ferredoxin family protein [Candidatus Bathyarchaeia archaeon]